MNKAEREDVKSTIKVIMQLDKNSLLITDAVAKSLAARAAVEKARKEKAGV